MGEDASRSEWGGGGGSRNQPYSVGVLRGPRVLHLRRDDHPDFGFTLRHFIVYPPDQYADTDASQRLPGLDAEELCQPMDTVFVKAVRAGSPADRAGLRTGDRLIAVENVPVGGVPVEGLSYAEVVRFIAAKTKLELKVVSQEYDLLQQYYYAHAPETNQRPTMQATIEAASARRKQIGHPVPWQSYQQNSLERSVSPRIPTWEQPDSQKELPRVWNPQESMSRKQQQHQRPDSSRSQSTRHHPSASSEMSWSTTSRPNDVWAPQQTSVWQNHNVSPRNQEQGWSGTEQKMRQAQSAVPQAPLQSASTVRTLKSAQETLTNTLASRLGPAAYGSQDQSVSRVGPVPYGSQSTPRNMSDMSRYAPIIYSSPEPIYHMPQSRTGQTKMTSDNVQTTRQFTSLPEPSTRLQQINTDYQQFSKINLDNSLLRNNSEQHKIQSVTDNHMLTKSYPAPWNSNYPDMQLTYRPIKASYTIPTVKPVTSCMPSVPCNIDNRRESNVSLCSTNTDMSKDSVCSYESLSTMTGHETDDSVIMNRLRRSVEQKEEFLRRPSQPTGWCLDTNINSNPNTNTNLLQLNNNSVNNIASNESVIRQKEFYARPQKMKNPLWPPIESVQSDNEMSLNSHTEVTERSGNQSNSNLIINERILSPLNIKRDRLTNSQHASLAESEDSDKFAGYPGLPTVSALSRQFETGRPLSPEGPEDRTSLYKSELSRLSCKMAVPTVAGRRKEIETKQAREREREARRRDSRSVESPDTASEPVPMRVRSHSAESQSGLERRGRRIRPESYIAAQREPTEKQRSDAIPSQPVDNSPDSKDPPISLKDLEPQERCPPAPIRPTQLSLAPLECDGINDLPHNGVVRRRKVHSLATDDSPMDYLKAREFIQDVLDDPQVQKLKGSYRRCRPPMFLSDIHQLKRLFEDPRFIHQSDDVVIRKDDKQGALQLKIVALDGTKHQNRCWKPIWVQIRGPKLHFFSHNKNHHHSTPESLKPVHELQSLDLSTSQVDVAGDYTKRKHVLRVSAPGVELLLQADSPSEMAHWMRKMQAAGAQHEFDLENHEDISVEGGAQLAEPQRAPAATSVPHKPSRKFPQFRSRSPTGQSPVNKTRKSTLTIPVTSDSPGLVDALQLSQQGQSPGQGSPKSKTWKGRIGRQLRRMGGGPGGQSPTSPTAEFGGSMGVRIESCPMSKRNECVPFLVDFCTAIVEERGLDSRGIYRVPGNTAAVQALTSMACRGLTQEDLQDPRWQDVNVISSLLKSFFRRLPDSLLTNTLYPMLIKADKLTEPVERLVQLRTLVRKLSKYHYETLKHIMDHLNRVVEHCEVNKMEARNLAIVFGPTLIRTSEDNLATMVTDMSHQCRIVESILTYVNWFFSPEEYCELPELVHEAVCDTSLSQPKPATHLLLENVVKVEAATKKLQKTFGRSKTTSLVPSSTSATSVNLSQIGIGSIYSMDTKSQRSDDTDTVSSNGQHVSAYDHTNTTSQTNTSRTTITSCDTITSQQSTNSSLVSECSNSNGVLKRFKTEQMDKTQLRNDHPARNSGEISDDSSDLLMSVTSTFDRLRSLLNTPTSLNPLSGPDNIPYADDSPDKLPGSPKHLRNPSLHRTELQAGRRTNMINNKSLKTSSSDSDAIKESEEGDRRSTSDVRRYKVINSASDAEQPEDHVLNESKNNGDVSCLDSDSASTSSSQNDKENSKSAYTGFIVKNTANYNLRTQNSAQIPVSIVKPMTSSSGYNMDAMKNINLLKLNVTDPSDSENMERTSNMKTNTNQSGALLTCTSDFQTPGKLLMVCTKPRHLIRSESLNKHDRTDSPTRNKLKRSESLNKKDEIKLKRSESLTKSEKTHNNYKTREQSLYKGAAKKDLKLKRKNGMPSKSIKRRHTVGGTKDYEMSPNIPRSKERVRTSSPDLNLGACARDSFLLEVSLRAPNHIIAEIRLSHNFLESHI